LKKWPVAIPAISLNTAKEIWFIEDNWGILSEARGKNIHRYVLWIADKIESLKF
jgi:hypothetical protein